MKTSLFTILLFSLAIALSSFSPDAAKNTSWLNGHWKGMKYQVNMNKAWNTELHIDVKSRTFTVAYPELNCSGKLVLQSVKGGKAIFEEQLGQGGCLTGGYIILTKVDDKHISFTCLRDEEQRLASYCTLERQ